MSNTIPLFASDASLGRSILTSNESESEINENSPVSIWTIAKVHNIDPVYVVETSFVNFISHYKNAQKEKKHLIFGIKFRVVSDAKQKSEESLLTESKIVVFMKNSAGYKDLVRLYSEFHGKEENFYYTGRGDWATLQKFWTDNLLLAIDFYDGFLASNLLQYEHKAIPEFGSIKPYFFVESHELPFDSLIYDATKQYCDATQDKMLNVHSIYYYRDSDIISYCTFRAIANRSSFEKPNLNGFSSDKFSFESYESTK